MKMRKRFFPVNAIKSFVLVLFVLVVLIFSLRNSLLDWGMEKMQVKLKNDYGLSLTVGRAAFTGISSLTITDMVLIPEKGDTIIRADSIRLSVRLFPLIYGSIQMKDLYASGASLHISCIDGNCNYKNLVQSEDSTIQTETKPNKSRNFAVMFKRLLTRAFNLAPQQAELENISLAYSNDTLNREVRIHKFTSDINSLSGIAEDLSTGANWLCRGRFSQDEHSLQLKVFPENGSSVPVPLFRELAGLFTGFDTIVLNLDGYQYKSNKLSMHGLFYFRNLKLHHQKISDDTVEVPRTSFDFTFHAGKNYLEIDSLSRAVVTNIQFTPYARYHTDTIKDYTLKLRTDNTAASEFFTSLPKGIFNDVRSIRAEGYVRYALDFHINSGNPDDATFDTQLEKMNFRLRGFGTSELLKIRDEFTYNIYERGRFTRSMVVGPSNPAFTPLHMISADLINAILTSEDGNFYFHNGFNEEAFRKSIIANFKTGKFVRGGSTISMQLVKNVFLTRKKTIARKAEEALIVWLIESNRLYTKDRMLEVYLNIAEFGPDVYGIGEASEFYFKKKPAEITLPEGIFLSSLLPRPRSFKHSFDSLGNLKPRFEDYYRVVSNFMLKKNMISPEEHEQLKPIVSLTGPAGKMILPEGSDTIEDFPDERVE